MAAVDVMPGDTTNFQWLSAKVTENERNQKILRLNFQVDMPMNELLIGLMPLFGAQQVEQKQGSAQVSQSARGSAATTKSPAPPPPATAPVPTSSVPMSRAGQAPVPVPQTSVPAKGAAPPPTAATTSLPPPTVSAPLPAAKAKGAAPAPAQPKEKPQERPAAETSSKPPPTESTSESKEKTGWPSKGADAIGFHIMDRAAVEKIMPVKIPFARYGRGGRPKPEETPVEAIPAVPLSPGFQSRDTEASPPLMSAVLAPPPGLGSPPSAPSFPPPTSSVKLDSGIQDGQPQ